MKTKYQHVIAFLVITVSLGFLYAGFEKNYFYSDDFYWISQGILVNDSFSELFVVFGRDFNPLLTFLFWGLIKIFGVSLWTFRALCFFSFAGALFLLYYHLTRYFKVDSTISLSMVLLCGFNVYISEVMLYLSTFVYALTMLLFLTALKFLFDKKRFLYLLFLLLAYHIKETIILATIPLFLYCAVVIKVSQKEKNTPGGTTDTPSPSLPLAGSKFNLLFFLAISTPLIFLTRYLFQASSTGSYTNFVNTENLLYKLYFLVLHPMNFSPLHIQLFLGIALAVIVTLSLAYFLRKEPAAIFFGSFFGLYVVFFAFLPKLSSKYYFYPTFAFWGCVALLAGILYKRNKKLKYLLFALVILSFIFNYPAMKNEIEDYHILGDYSKQLIDTQAQKIKKQIDMDSLVAPGNKGFELRIERPGFAGLAGAYQQVYDRGNILKLLPFRKHSIGGVLVPGNLVTIVFYPAHTVRWTNEKETATYFQGKCIISTGFSF